ncbi:Panacea domain-containing protein [Paracoccus marinaquae]|uniref:DUF4065 domain-containing protein n=1 Tax=Paracoccus marinaquae TaxID=2841926 RepID=A0ABS6AI37_9RHOB|nr:type II toxin-antitoxin system antitoxin SocA domain-containing protein [Paracoccus marinaquae]MBU3029757.1 DUF4065 domain-containing protein [Paracoccus marinaquae]
MANVFDAATYILEQCGPMTTMKLQKLIYYSQAWSTVWDDDVIFPEAIEAWQNGPVVRELWQETKGRFRIDAVSKGTSANLTDTQKETIDRVLGFYSNKDAQWLSDLTHMEDPWKMAYAEGQNTEIFPAWLVEYYSSIAPEQ